MTWTSARASLAVATRDGRLDDANNARRDMRAARAELYLRELVAKAPPLTTDQRAELAAILRPELAAQPAASAATAA